MEGEKEKMQEGRGRDVGLEAGPDHGEPSQPRSRRSARREGPDGDGSLYPADPDRAVRAEGLTRV